MAAELHHLMREQIAVSSVGAKTMESKGVPVKAVPQMTENRAKWRQLSGRCRCSHSRTVEGRKSVGSVFETGFGMLVAGTVLPILVGCGGPSTINISKPPGTPTPPAGATSVYVIQNPATFGSGSGAILQFSATATGSVSPTSTITASANTSFNGLATDSTGDIYVSTDTPASGSGSSTGENVLEYTAGGTGSATPTRTLAGNATTMIAAVDGIAASSEGEIFVSEDSGGVAVFSSTATGTVAPERYILGAAQTGGGLSTLIEANAVTADSSDNLYIVNEGAPGLMPICVFGPSATGNVAPSRTVGGALTKVSSPAAVATDSAGNLYVANHNSSILVFGPTANGNVAPTHTISGSSTLLGSLGGIKVDSVGNIYVISTNSSGKDPMVLKFSATATGNVAPTLSFTSSAWTNPDNNLSLAVH
jgi:sugar lactone lactonase YvrE